MRQAVLPFHPSDINQTSIPPQKKNECHASKPTPTPYIGPRHLTILNPTTSPPIVEVLKWRKDVEDKSCRIIWERSIGEKSFKELVEESWRGVYKRSASAGAPEGFKEMFKIINVLSKNKKTFQASTLHFFVLASDKKCIVQRFFAQVRLALCPLQEGSTRLGHAPSLFGLPRLRQVCQFRRWYNQTCQ